jgi:phage head maturation protease
VTSIALSAFIAGRAFFMLNSREMRMSFKITVENDKYHVRRELEDGSLGKSLGSFNSDEDAKAAILFAEGDNSDRLNSIKPDTPTKGLSLSEIRESLWDKFKQSFVHDYYSMWLQDVYPAEEDKYIIVSWHKKTFKIGFEGDPEGDVTFEEIQNWVEVKYRATYEPVEKTKEDAIKAIKSIGKDRIKGYAVVWGNTEKQDLSGEHFSKTDTKELLNVYKAVGKIPWLFEHTADGVLKSTVVALIDKMEEDEIGIWYEAKIHQHEVYRKFVEPLVSAKSLYSSSGTFPLAKSVKTDGTITRWPICEVSGTVTPMDHHQLEDGRIEQYRKSIEELENYVKFINSEFIENEKGSEEDRQDNGAADIKIVKRKQLELANELLELELANQ